MTSSRTNPARLDIGPTEIAHKAATLRFLLAPHFSQPVAKSGKKDRVDTYFNASMWEDIT